MTQRIKKRFRRRGRNNGEEPARGGPQDNGAFEYFRNGTIRGTVLDKAINDFCKKSGINLSTIEKYKIKINADRDLIKKRLGFSKVNGQDLCDVNRLIEIPYCNSEGRITQYAYKPITPVYDKEKNQRKYFNPKGKLAIPYILSEVWAVKDKVTKPLWITEGCKKALKLVQHGRHPISLSGVWNFKTKELDEFKWKGRLVFIGFDGDLETNTNVRMALYELAFKLYDKKAVVKVATWSRTEAKGIDDYLVAQAEPEKALDYIEEKAVNIISFIRPEEHKQEVVRALANVEFSNSDKESIYTSIAEKLKLSVSQLKTDVSNKKQDFNPTYPYYIDTRNGCLYKEKVVTNKNAEVTKTERIKLADFDARIVKDINRSDGVDTQRIYVLEGKTKDIDLPQIEVPAKVFNSLNWLEKWGSKAVVCPGNSLKDYVRHYIQINRQDQTGHFTQYSHTGWIKLDDEWIYITRDGAIGRENVSVNLSKENQRYNLPIKKVKEDQEKKSIKRSLSFLGVATPKITYPLFALAYIAPLTTLLEQPPNFVMCLYGKTGNYKSTLSTLLMCHYGKFNITQLPNFSDTSNAIEKRTSDLKDSLMILDDYHPTANRFESQAKESTLQRIIRSVSNRSGRTRLKSDASERGAYNPRAMVLVTGEALVQVESTLARVMIVEIEKKEEIDLEKLTKLQKHSKSLPRAMASYIDWLRPQIKEIQDLFIERFPILRTEFYQDGCHGKSSEQMAYLTFALEVTFKWMIEKEVITEKQSKKMLLESRKVFKSSIESHTLLLKTETPTHKYIEILSTLIVQEKVHLRELFGSTEVGSNRLGGQQIGGQFSKETGVHIGYFNDKYFYLFPKGTYKEIVTFSASTGQHFSTGERTILKMLKEDGILEPRGKNNTYTLNDVEGKNPTVMRLKRDKLVCV